MTTPDNGARFANDWLSLREAIDHRSRADGLAGFAGQYLRRTGTTPATVVDLGAGRGSNLRYLSRQFAAPGRPPIHWLLLDHDAALLAEARASAPPMPAGDRIDCECFDLAETLAPRLAGADLVTASALLDLVSRRWIDAVVAACNTQRAAVLIAISVDGRIVFSDTDPDDAAVRVALGVDQARDKSFGPALGAHAPSALIAALSHHGYAITCQPSDWHLDRRDMALITPLLAGWRDAAIRQRPADAARITAWAERRGAALATGSATLRVGHVDVLGVPGRCSR